MKKTNTISRLLCLLLAVMVFFTAQAVPAAASASDSDTHDPIFNGHKVVFDTVYFGSYPQTEVRGSDLTDAITGADYDDNGDAWVSGTKYRRIRVKDTTDQAHFVSSGYRYFKWERIKWRILDNDDTTMLMVACLGLDCQKYNEIDATVTWPDCTLRKWLNTKFFATAFNENEREAVTPQMVDNSSYQVGSSRDYVSLLSRDDMHNEDYGFEHQAYVKNDYRKLEASEFAYVMGAQIGNGTTSSGEPQHCWWWLRSPGDQNKDSFNYAAMVDYSGAFVYSRKVAMTNCAVVPSVQIKIGSHVWYRENDGTSGAGGGEGTFAPLTVGETQNLSADDTVTFQVTANGGISSDYMYEWYYAASESAAGARVEASEINVFQNTDSATLTTTGTIEQAELNALDGMFFYCVVSDGISTETSSRVRLTVEKHDQTISYQKNKFKNGKIVYGTTFSLGASSSGGGTLSYSSSNEKILTVNAAGRVKAKGYGKASITITTAAAGNYNAATQTINLTVIPKQVKITKAVVVAKDQKFATLSLQWNKDKTVSQYQYSIAYNNKFTAGINGNKAENTLTVRNIDISKKRIYIRVRSYMKKGNQYYYGKWSKSYHMDL